MKASRKAAVAGLRFWGACQAARLFPGSTPEDRMHDHLLMALGAHPLAETEGSLDAFQRLTLEQIISGKPVKTKQGPMPLPVICGTPEGARKLVADKARQNIRHGFGYGPRADQPFCQSEVGSETFLLIDAALVGECNRRMAFWHHVAGKRICDFRHGSEVTSDRAAYRRHDQIVSLVRDAIEDPEQTVVDGWCRELESRLRSRQWSTVPELCGVIFGELLEMQEPRRKEA